LKRSRSSNQECSIARAMDVVGDRWSILLLREAYYGTRRFDEFQYYLGVAPNILSTRLKKFVDLGMMTRVPLPEHGGRYEYVLTKKGRDFFPTYLALKKWGDDWLAEPEGPQVVFKDLISCCRGAASRCSSKTSKSFRAVAPCLSIESGSAVKRPKI
jgi:DNA-binding HxlR family transcriptional regulator